MHGHACESKSPCDYGRSGYKALMNERSLTSERSGRFGGMAAVVSLVVQHARSAGLSG